MPLNKLLHPFDFPKPVLGICAFSGTGKTSLLEKLIPLLTQRGLRIGLIKHAHHDFDIDQPGKDSYKLRKAGADQTLLISNKRLALMVENRHSQPEPQLQDALSRLNANELDLVLVEGFKLAKFAKLELYRAERRQPFLYPDDDSIIAIACDALSDLHRPITQLNINDPEQICQFILDLINDNTTHE